MRFRVLAACLLALASCAGAKDADSVAEIGLDFSWAETSGCFQPTSPAFTVSNVPDGTAYLRFTMTDLQAPSFNHGGGTVPYTGPTVRRGAFVYKGPCPPGAAHDYRWEVTALNRAKDTVLGRGSKTLPYHQ